MKTIILLGTLFIAACAPQIVYKPVPVDSPVPVLCRINPVTPPTPYTGTINPGASLYDMFQALAATNDQRKAYEVQLVAAIKSCQ